MSAAPPIFHVVGKVTIAELCFGIAILRGAAVPLATREIADWFDMVVGVADLETTIAGMMARGWLEGHPTRAGRYLLTEEGEAVVEHAFKGFVRFIDAGENRWDVGMMFQIAKTHYDRRKN